MGPMLTTAAEPGALVNDIRQFHTPISHQLVLFDLLLALQMRPFSNEIVAIRARLKVVAERLCAVDAAQL